MKAALFLHGFLSDPVVDFNSLQVALEDKKIYDKIEFVYYPGHGGLKDINYWNFYAIETVLKVQEVLINLQKEYEEIDLFGYSLGGALAMYLASKYNVNKVILFAPAYKYINNSFLRNKIKFSFKYMFNKKNRRFAKEQLRISKENDFIATRFFIRKYFKLYIAKAFGEFKSIISFVQRNTKDINCPTLICYGGLDELVPYKSVKAGFNKVININKKLMIYENMTHLMLASVNPEMIIKDVIDFVIGEKNEK